ncbi:MULTISPECIES: hypothetical protein [unclassified Rhizobium]|uniref:hypothetical protein n=1 Tax=unclassified Rhizobium TaxID=2613769 RepID=UPI00288C3C52|nr:MULTISPECIES: hypothetical protein [unclassified Rhizobium]
MTTSKDNKGSLEDIHDDAKGQFARGLKRSDNNGVDSAKPRVITGSDDATAHKYPPGTKPAKKEWDVNYDERETNEGDFRG